MRLKKCIFARHTYKANRTKPRKISPFVYLLNVVWNSICLWLQCSNQLKILPSWVTNTCSLNCKECDQMQHVKHHIQFNRCHCQLMPSINILGSTPKKQNRQIRYLATVSEGSLEVNKARTATHRSNFKCVRGLISSGL